MNLVGVLSVWSVAATGTALVFVSGSGNVGDAQQSAFPLNAGDMASDQRAADAGGIGQQYRDSLEQRQNEEGGPGRFFANRNLELEADVEGSTLDPTHEADESISLKEEKTQNNKGLGTMDLLLPRPEISPVSTNAPTETEERTEDMERHSHDSLLPSVVEEAKQRESDKNNLNTLHAEGQEDSPSVFMPEEEEDMLDHEESESQLRGLALFDGLGGGGGKRKKAKYPPIPVKTHPALAVPPPLEKASFPPSMPSSPPPCKHPQPMPNKSNMKGLEASDPPFLHPCMQKATKEDFYSSQQRSSCSSSKTNQGYKNTSLSSSYPSGGHYSKEAKYSKTIPNKSQMYEGSKEKNYSSFSSSYPSQPSSSFYGGKGGGGKGKNSPSKSMGFYPPPPSYSHDEELPYHQGFGSSSSFDPSAFHPSASFSPSHTMPNEYEQNFLGSSSGMGRDDISTYHGYNPSSPHHQGYEMNHERNSPSPPSLHPDQHSYGDRDQFHASSSYHGEASFNTPSSYSQYTPPSVPQKVY